MQSNVIAPPDFAIMSKANKLARAGYSVDVDYRNDVVTIRTPEGPRYLCGQVGSRFVDTLGETFRASHNCTVGQVALALAEPWIN